MASKEKDGLVTTTLLIRAEMAMNGTYFSCEISHYSSDRIRGCKTPTILVRCESVNDIVLKHS